MRKSWVWWLLPVLVARALVPAGFMAQATPQGVLQIVICQAGAPKFLTQAAAETHHADETGNKSAPDSSHWQNDHSCPFGHIAAAPVAHISGGERIAFLASSEVSVAEEPPYLAVGPPRVITNRGPPVHA